LIHQDARHERLGRACLESLSSYPEWKDAARLSEWKFGMLDFGKRAEWAVEEAQEAHWVVLATECLSGLPGGVKTWIE
jgi:hypothetical protein